MRTRVLVLISIAHLFLVLHAEASEPITLRLTFPEGRTVTYNHKYKSRYGSNQAEHILPQRIARPGTRRGRGQRFLAEFGACPNPGGGSRRGGSKRGDRNSRQGGRGDQQSDLRRQYRVQSGVGPL